MMPVIFIGHGSPMNAIEDNEFTNGWKEIANVISKPTVILSISAHWETNGTKVSTVENPKTIHDFYGFPEELYNVQYKAKGSSETAFKTIELLEGIAVADTSWGLDHGTWSVLHVMYPGADIPVYQMSIDRNATPQELFELGKKLKSLRDHNVLIMGSGNIVHNLGIMDYSMNGGFELAIEFNDYIIQKIEQRDFESIFNYKKLGDAARLAVPTTEHFNPLLYVLGATSNVDKVAIFNKSYMAGSLAMTSFVFSENEK